MQKNNEDISFQSCFIEEAEKFSSMLLPDPNMLFYFKDLNNRIIYIEDSNLNTVNGENNLLPIFRQIINFNKEDDENNVPIEQRVPIRLMIYTYGGLLEPALSFVNLCLISKTPIYTYNMGLAFSAGLIILLGGHKRFGFPNSQILIHEGSGEISGTAQQADLHMAHYKKQLEKIKELILNRTKIKSATYNKKVKTEWFIWAEESIELGIIDEIIKDLNQLY